MYSENCSENLVEKLVLVSEKQVEQHVETNEKHVQNLFGVAVRVFVRKHRRTNVVICP